MGGTQHNQGVKCLKYLFQICWFCFYHYFFKLLLHIWQFKQMPPVSRALLFLDFKKWVILCSCWDPIKKVKAGILLVRPRALVLALEGQMRLTNQDNGTVRFYLFRRKRENKINNTVLVVSFSLGYLSKGCWNLHAPFSVELKMSIQMKKMNWGGNAVTAISVCPTFLLHQE